MFGIKISSESIDPRKASIQQLSLDNNLKMLKIFKQGFIGVNVTGPGTYTAEIIHGLGYHPFYIFQSAPDPDFPERRYMGSFAADGGPIGSIGLDSGISKEKLILAWLDSSSAPGSFATYPYNVTFYYYIFYDPIE